MKNKLKVVESIRKTAEFDRVNKDMPIPVDVLQVAEHMEEAPVYRGSGDYAESVNVLRNKGYTWNEITEFLNNLGADFSMQAFVASWRNWKKKNK